MGGFSILMVLSVLTGCSFSTWHTYTNPGPSYQMQYPPNSYIESAPATGINIEIPVNTSGTNLVEKFMYSNVQEGGPICENPFVATKIPVAGFSTPVNMTINGLNWVMENGQGTSPDGTVNWDVTVYSTVRSGVCVSLTFEMDYTAPLYTTLPSFSPLESLVFFQIVTTFHWIRFIRQGVVPGAIPTLAIPTPTLAPGEIPSLVPSEVPSLVPGEIPSLVPSDTPASSALNFTPGVSPLEFNYYHQTKVLACIVKNPQVDISVTVSDPAVVHGMVLFFRLKNKADGAETAWNAGVNMNPQGNGVFDRSLSANQIPNLSAISASGGSAWLEYQFAATDALGGTIGRSPVYSNVALTPCGG